jgi:hypothetical protein
MSTRNGRQLNKHGALTERNAPFCTIISINTKLLAELTGELDTQLPHRGYVFVENQL